jgi:hypothetical protein
LYLQLTLHCLLCATATLPLLLLLLPLLNSDDGTDPADQLVAHRGRLICLIEHLCVGIEEASAAGSSGGRGSEREYALRYVKQCRAAAAALCAGACAMREGPDGEEALQEARKAYMDAYSEVSF